MKRGIIATVLLGGVLAFSSAQAVYLDEANSLQITGKVFTQPSLRMTDSDSGGLSCYPFGARCSGFTFPETKTGQLVQHRNLIDGEFYHNIARGLGPQFSLFDQLAYRLRVKWFYEGLYDYGPNGYSEPSSAFRANSVPALAEILRDGLRHNRYLDTQKDPIWNAYVDVARSSMKFRIGRQDLSWGESDGFRLLDMIEPLDNRFGFPLVEDLDDRRIPLWMVRPTWSIGTMGAVSNLVVDGFWVPGTIDNEIAPISPPGNPFGVGAPPGPSTVVRPSKNLSNSRGGARLMGHTAGVTFSLGHYVTYNDIPSARLKVDSLDFIPLGPDVTYFAPAGTFLVEIYKQQVTGASATFALPFDPYTIIRTEAAHFWDERVFKPAENVDLAVGRCFTQAAPCVGDLPTKNVMRWMIGFDRNVWVRWLNPENTFFLSGQYFHTNIFQFDRDIAIAVPSTTHFAAAPALGPGVYSTTFDWVPRKQDEITLTYLVNTLVWHGTIQPQVFGAYDFRGVNAVVPSVSYQWGTNFVFTMKYAIVRGTFANLGFFRDRDQLLFRIQYNLS